jgi:hypothetical protein
LPRLPNQFLQLYLYPVSVMCFAGSDAVFALHSHDEGPRETVRTRYGVEEGVRNFRLGVCGDGIVKGTRLRELA